MKDKQIIFFDGDGTMWYPKATKRTKKPHWIYTDTNIKDNFLKHLTLTPKARQTLLALKKAGITLGLISTHPHLKEEADKLLKSKIEHFKLQDIFDIFASAPEYPEGKGEVLVKILQQYKITKSKALMVGDSYYYDYLSAKRVGVDALFIENSYAKRPKSGRTTKNTISDIHELLEIVLQSKK